MLAQQPAVAAGIAGATAGIKKELPGSALADDDNKTPGVASEEEVEEED